MAHTIVIKLKSAARQFQAGDSTGFGIRGGVKYYDRDERGDRYTNYEAVIFSSNANQIEFYQKALVEGAILEVSGSSQRIKTFEGQNGVSYCIELLDAKLGFIGQSAVKHVDDANQHSQSEFHNAPHGGFQQGGYQQQPQGGYPAQGNFQQAPQGGYPAQGNFQQAPQGGYPAQGNFQQAPQGGFQQRGRR